MPPVTPDIHRVEALLRIRTRDKFQNEVGVWNEDTRPTGEQAAAMMAEAERQVKAKLGGVDPCTEALADDAAACIHLKAAMLIEISYFGEQVAKDLSPYPELKEQYKEEIETLLNGIERECGVNVGTDPDAGSQDPEYDFGCSEPLGDRTQW